MWICACSQTSGSKEFLSIRKIAARELGRQMCGKIAASGPILLVHRDLSPEVLAEIEKGLTDGLGQPRELIRICKDVGNNMTALTQPNAADIGLNEALAVHTDAAAVVLTCFLFTAPANPAMCPPTFAFDWPDHAYRRAMTLYPTGLLKGGVIQRALNSPTNPTEKPEDAFAAQYTSATSEGVHEANH